MSESQKRIALWGGVTVGIILLLWLLVRLGTGGAVGGSLSEAVNAEDHVLGNRDANVVLVEYSDFQCPFCARTYPIVKQLADMYPDDQVATVFRHFPLDQIHGNARLAAQASEAAAMQGKFWEYHDMLFNTQPQWSELDNPEEFFVSLANSLGLNTEQFTSDMKSNAAETAVIQDVASGNASGVQGTPSFYLNGQKIEVQPTLDAFKQVIDQALTE